MATQNRTLTCSDVERRGLEKKLLRVTEKAELSAIDGKIINGDFFEMAGYLPRGFVDLLILDPPYNLSNNYNGRAFKQMNSGDYAEWFERVVSLLLPTLNPHASIYVCADWKTSIAVAPVLEKFFRARNRITWEREKGRGAKANWKNNSEDIWFCTLTEDYYFDVAAVKLKRKVIAPYKEGGKPKGWQAEADGNFRLTHPSNLWTDISVPFWSMPENTDHPTQKPEKLLAKLILASCPEGGLVFDPFVGSGTSAVVAEKLRRRHCSIERDTTYCCWAQKRLDAAKRAPTIQGYEAGVFWERNSLHRQKKKKREAVTA